MSWISFSFYKDYFYFLIFWILDLVVTFINKFFDENVLNSYLRVNEYFHLITLNISDLLAGFLVLYTEIQMKTE
jgi:hypothetical protein